MIDQGAHLVHSLGAAWLTSYIPYYEGLLFLLEGSWEEAERLLEESIALATPSGDLQVLAPAHRSMAELDILRGRSESARDRLERLIRENATNQAEILATLAWSYLELGQLEQAEDASKQAVATATAGQQRFYLIHALRVQGMVLTRQQRWDEAHQALERAVGLADMISSPHARGRALYELGRMHRAKGERETARARLNDALAIFRDLGAVEDAKQAEGLLLDIERDVSSP
jgi:tetratricopeptide (TPR) repeat protein